MKTLPILLLFFIILKLCFPILPGLSRVQAQSEENDTFLIFQIDKITFSEDADVQIYVILTDGQNTTILMYHDFLETEYIHVRQGIPLSLSKYSIAIDETSLGDQIFAKIIITQSDATEYVMGIGLETGITWFTNWLLGPLSNLSKAILSYFSEGTSQTFFDGVDILVDATIVLERADNWQAGETKALEASTHNGVQIDYQVLLVTAP